ncbi:hypothetical protein DL764_001719 [Monosporascus ibericus]|uniref:Luciferase domain-containing protein n=1 Tax=Monosporascus ibericus TaxID=155417 RepID=A0A4V1XC68_9PEZI|nr:hypothetical protein DL764_001719 [Monosporascus ibericus]
MPNANSIRANQALVAGLAAALAGAPLLAYTLSNYRQWLAIEPGGLPYNFFGYLVNALMRPFARTDTRLPAPYDRSKLAPLYGPEASRSYFAGAQPPARRAGQRPDVPTFTVPQRQTSQKAPADTVGRERAFMEALAAANPRLLRLRASAAEGGHHDALWLADGVPRPGRYLNGLQGEFAHPHGEGSAHVTLSLADAEALVERGWAERHRLSGVLAAGISWGYVLVYAPRDEGEFEVWREILLASTRFVASASGEEVAVPE